jgi:hypothetical protein
MSSSTAAARSLERDNKSQQRAAQEDEAEDRHDLACGALRQQHLISATATAPLYPCSLRPRLWILSREQGRKCENTRQGKEIMAE